MSGAYFAAGPCAFCGLVFTFNPERVPSIPSNAWEIAEIAESSGEPPAKGTMLPVCGDCMQKVNRLREQHNMPPLPILPGAYDPAEGFPP